MAVDWSAETFGSTISFHRKHIYGGMAQNALAEKIGVSPQYVNDIENDRRVPSDDVISKLAEHLVLPDDYLYWMAGKLPPDLRQSEKDPLFVVTGLEILRAWFTARHNDERTRLGARSVGDAMWRLSKSAERLTAHANQARNSIEEWNDAYEQRKQDAQREAGR